jgi:dolichol-phosphate mannosyltransferase
MRKIVIIPTYNERENIEPLIHAIFDLRIDLDILVVDDNSPDGTGIHVAQLKEKLYRLHLLNRTDKAGLAKAYIAGMQWCLAQQYDVIVQMDADFSHRPIDLKNMLERLENFDGVVGSRYIEGGKTANWGLIRKIISRGGSFYAHTVLGHNLRDWTGGFNVWRRHVLEKIALPQISSGGYSFQIELKYRALQNGFRLREVPILFEDRRVGQSKMNLMIVLEALYRVWMIRFGQH